MLKWFVKDQRDMILLLLHIQPVHRSNKTNKGSTASDPLGKRDHATRVSKMALTITTLNQELAEFKIIRFEDQPQVQKAKLLYFTNYKS